MECERGTHTHMVSYANVGAYIKRGPIGTRIEQALDTIAIAESCGTMKWRLRELFDNVVDVGTALEQELDT